MDARRALQGIVAVFVIIGALFCLPTEVLADPVRIYFRQFDYPIPSPDDPNSPLGKGRMQDAFIEVPDCFAIQDVDVMVAITHEAFYDLRITLQSPSGEEVTLNPPLNPAFIIRDPNGRLISVAGSLQFFFDDEALTSISQAEPPFTDPYRPIESLSLFDGMDTYGPWRLQIEDCGYAHTGTLESVELIFTIPEPATAVLLILGSGLITLFQTRRNTTHR